MSQVWLVLFGQADITLGWADAIIKLTTAAGFGGLVWYLVVKHIPEIEERHRREREQYREYLDKRDERLEEIAILFAAEEIPSRLDTIERAIRDVRDHQ